MNFIATIAVLKFFRYSALAVSMERGDKSKEKAS